MGVFGVSSVVRRTTLRLAGVACAGSLVAGCGGGSPSTTCAAAPHLAIESYSTGATPFVAGIPPESGPYPTTATFLYFSTNPGSTTPQLASVTGVPELQGSDGSAISAGAIAPVFAVDVTPILFGYSASVSGLKPNLTYTVSFSSLTGSPSGCRYGAESAGSFQTQAAPSPA